MKLFPIFLLQKEGGLGAWIDAQGTTLDLELRRPTQS